MDTMLLGYSRQPLDNQYIVRRAAQLLGRGYTENEVKEIHRRAIQWINENLEPGPVSGKLEPMRRDYSIALAEVLADSIDIALGDYA